MSPRSRSGSGRRRSSSKRRPSTPVGNGEGASKGGSGFKKSKTGGGKRHTPPRIPLPPPRQEGDQISPAETTGPIPEPDTPSLAVQERIGIIESIDFEPDVLPMGFTNSDAPAYPTNVCYRNAVISMLLNIPTFSRLLTNHHTSQETRQEDPEAPPYPPAHMVQSLASLNRIYWAGAASEEQKQTELNDEMDVFFKAFVARNSEFDAPHNNNAWRQEDAEEFLGALLQSIEEELGRNDSDLSDSLQTLLTFGLLRKTHCVNGCQTKKLRGSVITRERIGRCHLLTGLPKGQTHKTFQEALNSSLIEFNDIFCQKCKTKTRHRTSQEFVELPKLFFTMLNRNTEDMANFKIETDCPLPTSFVPVVDQNCKQQNSKYRIAGVVAHKGAHGNSGHNISYVPNHEEPGEWYMINDKTVTRIRFKDVNKFRLNRKAAQQLPYIIAWELMDASSETADEKNEREAAKGNEEELSMQHLEQREKTLDAREKELEEKEDAFLEELKKKEDTFVEQLKDREDDFLGMEDDLISTAFDLDHRRIQLDHREKALSQREQTIKKREKDVQARRKVDKPLHTSSKDNATPAKQPEADAKGQIEQEVNQRRDAATFCATFRNNQNHEENARAIFKLNNFNPDAPTKIESTVQLSDLQGNLRSIKRGTAVTDDYTITFNVKGAKKRKRDEGDDDDEAGPPPSPKKEGKGPNRQGGKPPKSPIEEAQKSPARSIDPKDRETSRRNHRTRISR